jgi:hypothetical protein
MPAELRVTAAAMAAYFTIFIFDLPGMRPAGTSGRAMDFSAGVRRLRLNASILIM